MTPQSHQDRWAGHHPQKVADSVSLSTRINTECSTLFLLKGNVSQHRHIQSQSLGGSIVQVMHKEVTSSRPEETLCGQEKILKHWQKEKTALWWHPQSLQFIFSKCYHYSMDGHWTLCMYYKNEKRLLCIYCIQYICTDGVNRKVCWPWRCKDWLTMRNWWFNNLYWCCPSLNDTVTCSEMKNVHSAMKPSMIFRPVINFTSSWRWLSQGYKIGFGTTTKQDPQIK